MQIQTATQNPSSSLPSANGFDLETFVTRCAEASLAEDAQDEVAKLLREVIQVGPGPLTAALSAHSDLSDLENLVVYRSEKLTVLHGLLPPGFRAAPHNHNLWSVIAVYDGQEDNTFYRRDGDALREVRRISVVGPDVLCNDADAIHAIHNPLSTELRAIHVYGGDLFDTERSNWDAETLEESRYDWRNVAK